MCTFLWAPLAFAASLSNGPESALVPFCPFDSAKAALLFQDAYLKEVPLTEIEKKFISLSDAHGPCTKIEMGPKSPELTFGEAVVALEISRDADGKIRKLDSLPSEFRNDSWEKISLRGNRIYPQGFSFLVTDETGRRVESQKPGVALEVADSGDLRLLREIREKIAAGALKRETKVSGQPLEKQLELLMLEKNEGSRKALLTMLARKRFGSRVSTTDLCEDLPALQTDPILKKAHSVLRRRGSWEMVAGVSAWNQGVRQVTEIMAPPNGGPARCISITLNATKGVEADRSEEIFSRIFGMLAKNSSPTVEPAPALKP
jgi:hypothetical protein